MSQVAEEHIMTETFCMSFRSINKQTNLDVTVLDLPMCNGSETFWDQVI